jgi:anti-anti-sigma regulatory factor
MKPGKHSAPPFVQLARQGELKHGLGMSTVARLTEGSEEGRRVLRFSGDLTLSRLGVLPTRLDRLKGSGFLVDLSDVARVDTVGAWMIHRTARDRGAEVVGANPNVARLLRRMEEVDKPVKVRPDPPPPLTRILNQLGAATIESGRTFIGLLSFFGAMLISVVRVAREPRRFRLNAVVQRFEVVGVHAFAIIGLMSFLVGIVIAQQGAVQLRQFGAEVFTVNLIGRSAVKELGVLMTAIMVAGRSGSSFAAQLGSMKLAEEVDAMRTIGVSPMEGARPSPGSRHRADDAAPGLLCGGGGGDRRRRLHLGRARYPTHHLCAAHPGSVPVTDLWAAADQGTRVRPHHRAGRLLPGRCRSKSSAEEVGLVPPRRWCRASSW